MSIGRWYPWSSSVATGDYQLTLSLAAVPDVGDTLATAADTGVRSFGGTFSDNQVTDVASYGGAIANKSDASQLDDKTDQAPLTIESSTFSGMPSGRVASKRMRPR